MFQAGTKEKLKEEFSGLKLDLTVPDTVITFL
jgi:hypothetical protein